MLPLCKHALYPALLYSASPNGSSSVPDTYQALGVGQDSTSLV